MTRPQTLRIGILLLGLVPSAAAPVVAQDDSAATRPSAAHRGPVTATPDELHRLIDAGKFRDALDKIQHVEALRPPFSDVYNHHQVEMMKAECQLQLHQTRFAIGTLMLDRHDAYAAHNADDADADGAMKVLIESSSYSGYVPRHGADRKPIDILGVKSREAAYKALFDDVYATFKQENWESKTYASLQPIMDVVNSFADLRAVEHVASKTTKESDEIGKSLSTWAGELIAKALTRGWYDVLPGIDRRARVVIQVRDAVNPRRIISQHGTGLTDDDFAMLKRIATDCEQISATTGDLASAFGNPFLFQELSTKADKVKTRALEMLTTDYINGRPPVYKWSTRRTGGTGGTATKDLNAIQ